MSINQVDYEIIVAFQNILKIPRIDFINSVVKDKMTKSIKFTFEDIIDILHINSLEYDYCLEDVEELNKDKKTRENIIKKLKKI